MLDSPRGVVHALVTYADWWQPATSSIMQVGKARRDNTIGDGLNPGLIETLDERTELSRRVTQLSERDRKLLFLWYVRHRHVDDIAPELGISRRQCFRRKADAIKKIVDLGESDQAA